MTYLMALSISTGILCGIWSQISIPMGMFTWAGFAGCTTYFASGKHKMEGFLLTIRQNIFGVFCGMMIIVLGDHFPFPGSIIIFSGLVTFIMCIAGKYKYFAFIPGTFVGCFSTFAGNGDWKILIPSLFLGALLGIGCELGGDLLFSIFGKNETEKQD
ncbi:DUF1097 domain-containing protein [Anaerosalibacter massiliensis]|uniref:DUF1097 domain-containing protein n=1 Tax=Anaerosalibacter massiliensis TaxID=1347392 RepID=A0A9X2MFE0_9FIRM|nr:DUF1097 domain-containing protein [Anaerosalibacter massiliensis]MCR2043010.1 DUF1097 domain-containing protein [Anaerosalibacter massiliensis]